MKNLALCFLLLITITACQQQKIGFVDNVVLINEYQERVDIEAKLQLKITAFKTRTDSLRSAFELEIKEAELKARKMSQSSIQKLEQILQQRVQLEQQSIAQESQTLNDSIVNKVIGFVKDYGMSNNFNYILGSNEAGSVLYGDDAMDLTQEILKSLNEAYSKN